MEATVAAPATAGVGVAAWMRGVRFVLEALGGGSPACAEALRELDGGPG